MARVTLYDVAAHAGVALNTARRALADDPTVRRANRERVHNSAETLDYHPNLLARALKEKILRLVPISVLELSNPYYGSLASQLSQRLVADDFEPALCFNSSHLMKVSRSLPVSGSILVWGFDADVIQWLSRRQKVVTIDSHLQPIRGVGNVEVVFEQVYRQLVRQLIHDGHRRIGMYSVFFHEALEHQWYEEKFNTVLDELRTAGLAPAGGSPTGVFKTVTELREWLASGSKNVDAIICGNDLEAAAVMNVLADLGLKVPDDLRVIGCDANFLLPGMWSIRLDTAIIAEEAVGLLQDLLRGANRALSRRYVPILVDDQNQPLPLDV